MNPIEKAQDTQVNPKTEWKQPRFSTSEAAGKGKTDLRAFFTPHPTPPHPLFHEYSIFHEWASKILAKLPPAITYSHYQKLPKRRVF